MKLNLIPPEQQASPWERLPPQLTDMALALAAALTLGFGAAGAVFYWQTANEQVRFTDQAFPIQQHIMRQNELERQLGALKERNDAGRIKQIHWPVVLVCLADTKPDGAAAERIEVRQNTISVYGSAEASHAERAWQDALRRQPSVRSVAANRLKRSEPDKQAAFQLDIEWAYDEAASS